MKVIRLLFLILNLSIIISVQILGAENKFSRIMLYDVRGANQDETALILEQQDQEVKVWLQNYIGYRKGQVPYTEYQRCFDAMCKIKKFALRKERRGRSLRARAAKGTITLTWEDNKGKQIKTIHYYAPENTLENFREAFNNIWALSRYAILSIESLESPRLEYLEDAVYFFSGAGWMTRREIKKVMRFHKERGFAARVARALWRALDYKYPKGSVFESSEYLEYCIEKGMLLLGTSSATFLQSKDLIISRKKVPLAKKILNKLGINQYAFNHPKVAVSFSHSQQAKYTNIGLNSKAITKNKLSQVKNTLEKVGHTSKKIASKQGATSGVKITRRIKPVAEVVKPRSIKSIWEF